jgi:histidinol-phosphate aminotransferase
MVMKTLSKVGLAGVRVGFAMARPEIIAELDKARAPYNISSLNQTAAEWALGNCRQTLRDHCAVVVRERQGLAKELTAQPGLHVFASQANLLLFRVGIAGQGDGPRLWQRLCDQGVLIRCFGSEGPLADCLRVTIGSPEENQRFLAALRSA